MGGWLQEGHACSRTAAAAVARCGWGRRGGGLALPGDHCPSVLQIPESETWELEKVCFIAIIVGLPESKGLLCL